ncbi:MULTISPECIES: hypothetical protein [unclassified Streptomyces]|uniref:hypothetical protein n=1 Tax=unclassified Streptomyces TaxID=2593676 RepID=UPI0020302A30|nr:MULTISPECIES: hypothetical protein [unclassified Streptomyces]MCM1975123.1 hypothetical protein [Streptomyces sp. G1]MCX5296103.1 hypothetical protein [Streptomyces sp. NBC_00193]
MTERDNVTVNDPRGPVNNGSGHQNVYYGIGPDWMTRKKVASLRITLEDRVRLADRFAPPLHYRTAADRLEKPGSVVLLEAPPGSGRRAAAIMLLHRLGEDGHGPCDGDDEGGRFEELPATDKDEAEDETALPPTEGDRFLLDLSTITDEETYAKAQRLLDVRRAQVQAAGAHMVVVLPYGMEHVHSPFLEPHTVKLGRPRGIAVVTRYLRMDQMPFRPADLEGADLQRLYDRSPMRELARLAGLVRTARESGRFGAGFSDWLDQAVHAVTDRAGDVARQVAEVRAAPERALLLAAAVFEGTHADTVYAAWQSLMSTVGREDEEATTELARTDFGARLKALRIERDPEGRLRFDRLAYADAVRNYFWANFPGIRDDLRDWIADAAGLQGLTTDDRVTVAIRFGERSLATGRPSDVFDLVVEWAAGETGGSYDPRALAALELGLGHDGFGGWFRKRMYESVTSGDPSEGLVRVLTAACVRSLGTTHPDQAMVRLRHLAVRKGEAAREAREALLHLAGRDRRHYRLLIDRLLRYPPRQDPHEAQSRILLLTELLRSDRAPVPPPWPDLALGWEAVFSQPPTDLWKPLVTSWLDSVARDRAQEPALAAMAGAAHGRGAALLRLYAIAYAWAGPAHHPSRATVATRFRQHIDDAQYARTERAGAGSRTTEEAR